MNPQPSTSTLNPQPHVDGLIVDLFAGPGGWSEALRQLGHHAREIAFEWEADACATRAAAGLKTTIRADVAAYPTAPLVGRVSGLIASPPCQTFSMGGKGTGLHEIDAIVAAARAGLTDAGTSDPRSNLILEPLRWIHDLDPEWIVLEQVPEALPVWRGYEHRLRDLGYSTWTGVLNAADYGVPQARNRAILIASRTGGAGHPPATHAPHAGRTSLFDNSPSWVTMAEALAWPDDLPRTIRLDRRQTGAPLVDPFRKPAPTVTGTSIGKTVWTLRDLARPGEPVELRLTLRDGLILQGFDPDRPTIGNRISAGLQIGNAIPPGLAAAILKKVLP